MSRRLHVVRSVGAVALLAQCATVNALFTAPETEAFSLSTSSFGFNVEQDDDLVTVNTNGGPTTKSQNLTFDKFDTGLGQLLGVRVTYTTLYGAVATLNVTRFDGEPPVTFFANGSFILSLTGSGLNQSLSPTIVASCTPAPPGGTGPCSDSATQSNVAFNGTSPIGVPPFSSFFGPGTFILTATLASAINPRVSPDNGTSFADNSTMAGTLSDNWSGNVSVQYEYEKAATGAVPEPYTLYLLLAGAGAFALSRRRRRA